MMVQCAEPTTRGWSQYWSKFSWRTVDWPILSQGWRWRRENDWGEPRWWPFWGFRGRVAIRKRKS
ncbi:MAG TPA: hypothetical protein VLL52_11705, partial [Anaerolineae bacterium]|nr:hypothetical protein [Anaerolineae bacterium]